MDPATQAMAATVFKGMTALGALAGGGAAVKTVLTAPPKPPPIPALKEPPAMPTPDDAAAEEARRRKIADISSRSGKESTFLSDIGRGDRLGAG